MISLRSHRRLIRLRNALRRLLDIATAPRWVLCQLKDRRHAEDAR